MTDKRGHYYCVICEVMLFNLYGFEQHAKIYHNMNVLELEKKKDET